MKVDFMDFKDFSHILKWILNGQEWLLPQCMYCNMNLNWITYTFIWIKINYEIYRGTPQKSLFQFAKTYGWCQIKVENIEQIGNGKYQWHSFWETFGSLKPMGFVTFSCPISLPNTFSATSPNVHFLWFS